MNTIISIYKLATTGLHDLMVPLTEVLVSSFVTPVRRGTVEIFPAFIDSIGGFVRKYSRNLSSFSLSTEGPGLRTEAKLVMKDSGVPS